MMLVSGFRQNIGRVTSTQPVNLKAISAGFSTFKDNIPQVSPVDGSLSQKTLVVLGSTSQMGPSIVKKGVEKEYDRIIACTRNPPQKERQGPVKWLQVNESCISSIKYWHDKFEELIPKGDKVVVINTIGVAVAPKGQQLEDINEKPVLAVAKALSSLKHSHQRVAMGHFSTIAATYFPEDPQEQNYFCPQAVSYCKGRQKVDKLLADSGIPVTIVRPGFIFNDSNGTMIDTGHPYSPEQFASMSLQPVLGSGQQIQQPVYQQDVIDALMNGVEQDEVHIVDAVGPEAMTQEQMFQFYVELAGKSFNPVHIPYELAHAVATYFPKGRVAPYSIGMFKFLEEQGKEPLCKKKFESLVGKPLKSMREVYQDMNGQTYIFSKAPITEHVKEAFSTIMSNPKALKVMTKMMAKYGPTLCAQAVRQYVSGGSSRT